MVATPQWFDESYYINEKANQLLSTYPDQYKDLDTAKEAFLDALDQQGLTPYDHYVLWGDEEGLSPNPLFDREYYINQKAQQLVNAGEATDIDAAKEKFLDALEELGMTVYEHFHKWGWKEGINPSDVFDLNTYFSNKLSQLKKLDSDKYGDWTVDKVKEAFGDAGLDPIQHALLYGKGEGVVPSDALDQIEKAKNPGQNFTLTSDTDTITGTSGADTITGLVSALSKEKTLNPTDQIDGGDGKDTIELDVKGSFSGFSGDGKLANVETVKLTNSGSISRTFTAKEVTGVEKYIIEAEKSTVNLSSLAEIPDEVDLKVAKDTTIGFASNVTSGSSDAMTIKVEDMGSSSKDITVTANGIENVTLNSAGSSGNYIILTDNAIKELTIQGSADLNLRGLASTLTSVDGSSAKGNLTIYLTNAGTSLETVKTGSGDDIMKVDFGKIKANAEIDGGEGTDILEVNSSAANTVQFKMGNVETIKFNNITGAVTFSAKDTSGVENIIATKNVAQDITLAKLGGVDLNVELQGANASGNTVSIDNSGSTVVNVDTPSSNATATSPDENQLEIHLTNSTSLDLKVASNMAYSGDITAGKAETLTISVDGQLSNTTAGNIATITAANATSVTISKVAHDSALELQAAKAVSLNATASADLNLNPAGTTPNLSGLQELTISIEGDNNVATLPNLPKIHSIALSGTGSVDLGNLGSKTLSDYGIEIDASDLAGNDATAAGVSLDIGNIDTKGTDITVDASKVLGKVNIGAINALNGAKTAGDVTLDFDGTGGDITFGNIIGKDVTIDAGGMLGNITYGNITVYNSADITGSNLEDNWLTVVPTGKNDVSITIVGGIDDDKFTIKPSAGFAKKVSIDVTGDTQHPGTKDMLILDATNADITVSKLSFSGIENIDVHGGNKVKVNASDVSGKSFALGGGTAAGQDLIVQGTSGADTIDMSNVTADAAKADNLQIIGGAGADTITASGAVDKIILNSFNTADNIKDFTSGTDWIGIDILKGGTGAGWSSPNKIKANAFSAGNKLFVITHTGKNAGIKTVGSAVMFTKTTKTVNQGFALKAKALFTASKLSKLKSAITKTANLTFAANEKASGVIFGFTTNSKKLYLFVISDTNGIGVGKSNGQKIVVTKTLATLGVNVAAGDIHVF